MRASDLVVLGYRCYQLAVLPYSPTRVRAFMASCTIGSDILEFGT